ncbi:hypothetical protein BC939DRAFT_170084 [Gamsiella multidivaricata]|uniref:uncharacterized protein n=1 Tax=Gamsiella multidivaricata TaxID=101098 RepID=UPI002221148A|nr:uncharacterized protein BC939DRAFT_170084 [Gamsiella multidivaricata]KAI7823019.1 hypothetical protein BC939DRAFT_170084 [Gamsiella multidivaricata]
MGEEEGSVLSRGGYMVVLGSGRERVQKRDAVGERRKGSWTGGLALYCTGHPGATQLCSLDKGGEGVFLQLEGAIWTKAVSSTARNRAKPILGRGGTPRREDKQRRCAKGCMGARLGRRRGERKARGAEEALFFKESREAAVAEQKKEEREMGEMGRMGRPVAGKEESGEE